MPVRLLGVAAVGQARDRFVVEACGDLGPDEHGVRLGQAQFTAVHSHLHVVDFEVDQVAAAVADVVAPGADAFAPVVVSQSAVEFDVRAAKADAFAVYAGEVGLAADARAETAVECVIPNVQFPNRRRIDHREEVHGRNRLAVRAGNHVGDIGDVFVGADAVERRHLVGWQGRAGLLEPPAGMCRADERALALCPAEGVEAELGPVVLGFAAGIHLVI